MYCVSSSTHSAFIYLIAILLGVYTYFHLKLPLSKLLKQNIAKSIWAWNKFGVDHGMDFESSGILISTVDRFCRSVHLDNDSKYEKWQLSGRLIIFSCYNRTSIREHLSGRQRAILPSLSIYSPLGSRACYIGRYLPSHIAYLSRLSGCPWG